MDISQYLKSKKFQKEGGGITNFLKVFYFYFKIKYENKKTNIIKMIKIIIINIKI